jgi:hypothetical protein
MSESFGQLLYQLLPEVYRNRDNPHRDATGRITEEGELAHYLAALGTLLDRLRLTLDQRLADAFPDGDGDRPCQPWVIDYFARLLDARLVSPDFAGQQAEVANAVAWRQRKGTRGGIEAIAQAVGRMEVELQEGWRRVAVTPRMATPLLPATALGALEAPAMQIPSRAAQHPGLPAATVDLRRLSRAVRVTAENPAAYRSVFAGNTYYWRQANPHGVPCARDSFQDSSRRIPDLRHPTWNRGHYHPHRLLLFTPPPHGYFTPEPTSVAWTEDGTEAFAAWVETETVQASWNGHDCTMHIYRGKGEQPVKLTGTLALSEPCIYRFKNLWLEDTVTVSAGRLELEGCAARRVEVQTTGSDTPVLEARDTVLGELQAVISRLEYCTVLGEAVSQTLEASDCVFMAPLRRTVGSDTSPQFGCVRYSRLAPQDLGELPVYEPSCTRIPPWFFSTSFGAPACGVLHPAAAEAIRFGAEDGGEMGAYHARRYALRFNAVIDKLRDFLPVGIEGVWVPDESLLCPPPVAQVIH